MNNWKTVGRIATAFAVISIVFAVFEALITYNGMNLNPGYYSMDTIELNVISAMLNYLLLAALSFTAAMFCLGAGKESTQAETLLPEARSTESKLPEAKSAETELAETDSIQTQG